MELRRTLAGEPLYRACGYRVIEPFTSRTGAGVEVSADPHAESLDLRCGRRDKRAEI